MKDYAKKIVALFCMSFMLITVSFTQSQSFLVKKLDGSLESHTLVKDNVWKIVKLDLSAVPGTPVEKYDAFMNPDIPIPVTKYDSIKFNNTGLYVSKWEKKESLLYASDNPKWILSIQKVEYQVFTKIAWGLILVYLFIVFISFFLGAELRSSYFEADGEGLETIRKSGGLFLMGIPLGILMSFDSDYSAEIGLYFMLGGILGALIFIILHEVFELFKDSSFDVFCIIMSGVGLGLLGKNLLTLALPLAIIFIFSFTLGFVARYLAHKRSLKKSVKYA